jgi:hypothetical protein
LQVLNKRKGFVRIALQTGAQLVPVIGFGENDLYDIKEPGPWRLKLTRFTKKYFGFTLPNPSGLGFFWGKSQSIRSSLQWSCAAGAGEATQGVSRVRRTCCRQLLTNTTLPQCLTCIAAC